MNKDDALRKVIALYTLANGGTSEGEASAARSKADKLRLKFGISDADMEFEQEPEIEFFGVKFMFYAKRIAPLMDGIRANVKSALKRANDEDSRNRLDVIVHLLGDMKYQVELITKARDEAVKEAYKEKIAEYVARGFAADDPHAHSMSVSMIKGDLRKDTVERIVGVFENVLYRKQAEEYLANEKDRDGLDGPAEAAGERQGEEAG